MPSGVGGDVTGITPCRRAPHPPLRDKAPLAPPTGAGAQRAAKGAAGGLGGLDGTSLAQSLWMEVPAMPHGNTAVEGRERPAWRAAPADPEALAWLLDQMPVSIFLVARAARMVWMNLSARRLVRCGDGLALSDGRLVVTSHGQRPSLADVVRRALDGGDAEPARDPQVIMISRSSGSSPLVVVCLRVGARARGQAERKTEAALFVSDPDRGLRTSRKRLRQLFDLTPAEAEFAALLAGGYAVRAAAARLGISEETARTHVKRVFLKTGVRRQAELVRLALAAATAGAIEP
jgi:DNA-binding CsgD family transcriptional regulator